MKGMVISCIVVAAQAIAMLAQAATYQEKVFRIERGEYASQIDESIQNRIETDLRQRDPKWEVKTLAHSSTANHRLLELSNGDMIATVSIQYLLTDNDSAKHLHYRLQMISMPRYKPVKGLGEEAYLLTEKGPTWFRVGRIVVELRSSDGLAETQRTLADRIIASANGR